jgi:hypothetical protein
MLELPGGFFTEMLGPSDTEEDERVKEHYMWGNGFELAVDAPRTWKLPSIRLSPTMQG